MKGVRQSLMDPALRIWYFVCRGLFGILHLKYSKIFITRFSAPFEIFHTRAHDCLNPARLGPATWSAVSR